jgi:hypothetical protein
MSRPPRAVFVAGAVAGAAVACVLCLPATAWLLMAPVGGTGPKQYLVFAAANLLVAAVGSIPGVLGLVFYAGPKGPRNGG